MCINEETKLNLKLNSQFIGLKTNALKEGLDRGRQREKGNNRKGERKDKKRGRERSSRASESIRSSRDCVHARVLQAYERARIRDHERDAQKETKRHYVKLHVCGWVQMGACVSIRVSIIYSSLAHAHLIDTYVQIK